MVLLHDVSAQILESLGPAGTTGAEVQKEGTEGQ